MPWSGYQTYDLPYSHVITVPYFDSYSSGITSYLDIPPLKSTNQQLQPLPQSVEKPVTEPSLEPPPPNQGPARVSVIIPQPFGAAQGNSNGPIALGSGSLGVVQLANGGFALGSGSIGYATPINRVGQTQPPQTTSQAPLEVVTYDLGPEQVSFSLAPVEGYVPQTEVNLNTLPPITQQFNPGRVGSTTQQASNTQAANQIQDKTQQSNQQMQIMQSFPVRRPPETRGYSSTIGLSGFSS